MPQTITPVPDGFGEQVDDIVDQLDRAYQDGKEDLGNQLIELIRDYEAEEFPAEVALPNLERFIENAIGFTQDEDDDDVFDDDLYFWDDEDEEDWEDDDLWDDDLDDFPDDIDLPEAA